MRANSRGQANGGRWLRGGGGGGGGGGDGGDGRGQVEPDRGAGRGRGRGRGRITRGDAAVALHPRQDWKEWPELTVELRELPTNTTTLDLWKQLKPWGTIIYINFDRRDVGVARVRFSPAPNTAFWDTGRLSLHFGRGKDVQARVSCLRRFPASMITSPVRSDVEYPTRSSMRSLGVEFGILSSENKMQIMRSLRYMDGSPHEIKFSVELSYKKLVITFPCFMLDPRREDATMAVPRGAGEIGAREGSPMSPPYYKTAIQFSQLTKVLRVNYDEGKWALVIPVATPPPFFRLRRNIELSHATERDRWSESDMWKRTGDVMYDLEWLKHERVSLKKPYQFIDVGRWTTYRLLFDSRHEREWSAISNALQDFNIQVEVTNSESFTTEAGTSANKLWNLVDPAVTRSQLALLDESANVYLPFQVRYQLEAAISQNVFSEQSISLDFLKQLVAIGPYPDQYVKRAMAILEYVTDVGKRIYDPMSIFSDSHALKYRPEMRLPKHCAWVRKVIVTPSTVHICSPSVEVTNRVLRKYSHNSDLFLRVQFLDERSEGPLRSAHDTDRNDDLFNRVHRTLANGIQIGDRHFEFLAFGNSQFREHGAYFFCPPGHQSCEDIRNWMGDFRHIKVVAKYAARLGQCFSTTRAPEGLAMGLTIKEVPDIERNGFCFSDGCGLMSPLVADQVAEKLGMYQAGRVPSAFQFRLGGSKGILVVWDKAAFNQVLIRPSQNKFQAMAKNIEIIRPSRYSVATLNRQTIMILSCLGVPDAVFIQLTKHQLSDYKIAMSDPAVALRLLGRFVDENSVTTSIAQMVVDGFMQTDEPFFCAILQLWRAWSMKLLREKARIVVEHGAFLLGCVDETGTLRGHQNQPHPDQVASDKSNAMQGYQAYEAAGIKSKHARKLPQIFLQVPKVEDPVSYRVITGVCVVGRNPSLHPGDLRVVEAVDVPALHHLRDVVVFPSQGDQDIPSMCSGGDLDGDDFFVFWDPNLIPAEWNYPAMNHQPAQPKEKDRDVTIADVASFFVEYIKNDSLGEIANAHLAMADYVRDGPKDHRCLQLAQLHSNAVDYVKTGQSAHMTAKLRLDRKPHFMEKQRSYQSSKILGKLYDMVTAVNFTPRYDAPFDDRILRRYRLDDEILAKAREIKSQYDAAMRRIMNQREIKTEFEIWTSFVMSKPRVGSDYKLQEDMGIVMVALRDRFTASILHAAGCKEREPEKLYPFIAAAYRITWEEVQIARQECQQTILVAGRLIPKREMVAEQMPLISFPWLFEQELGRIARDVSDEGMALDSTPVAPQLKAAEEGQHLQAEAAVLLADGRVLHRGTELFIGGNSIIDEADEDVPQEALVTATLKGAEVARESQKADKPEVIVEESAKIVEQGSGKILVEEIEAEIEEKTEEKMEKASEAEIKEDIEEDIEEEIEQEIVEEIEEEVDNGGGLGALSALTRL